MKKNTEKKYVIHNTGYMILARLKARGGFTLVEILIYATIFSVSAVFLVNILAAITNIQLRQASVNEVNQQLSFVSEMIKRSVRESSAISNTAGTASSSISLLMASSSLSPTVFYTNLSVLYMQEGTSTAVALTNDKVAVNNFSATKYENPGGTAVVQVDLTLDYNTSSTQSKVSQTWRSAIARVSAATFDSSLLPNADGTLNLGASSAKWQDAYFGGTMRSAGDIAFTSSSIGLILESTSSTCARLGVNNALSAITLDPVACP
ncbi:MAG: type II secretion system protein [Candidatus Jorgensenbacteria bacterium]|nr:type II secretion system protein [Candidatus Jorgensenbacteria bacterium]